MMLLLVQGGASNKESAYQCSGWDVGSIPGSERSPGAGNSNPLQYSCLGNPVDRGAWGAMVCGISRELDMTEPLKQQQ